MFVFTRPYFGAARQKPVRGCTKIARKYKGLALKKAFRQGQLVRAKIYLQKPKYVIRFHLSRPAASSVEDVLFHEEIPL
jgi:hypothetical protein